MQDAWRAYLEMALGLTEAPRKRAQKVASDLVNRGGATAVQVQGLVEDLMSTGMQNREALTNIVRFEVDRALGMVGLATADEVKDLTTRVRDLEKQLRVAQARVSAAEHATGPGSGGDVLDRPAPLPAKKVAKKAVKKAVPVADDLTTPPAKKATPNQMPSAATPPAKKATPSKAAPSKAAPSKAAPSKAAPVKAGPVKAAPVKKATPVKKSSPPVVKATPAAPAGTAESPVAGVVDAAAATELPPVAKSAPVKKAGKKAAAKKVTPAKSQPVKSQPPSRSQPSKSQSEADK
jgi:polyhydroxyalkanoate synthesis regulator phasin